MPSGKVSRADAQARYRVADALHSAAIHLLRRLRRVDEETGLGGAELSALSVIVYAGPISLGDLAVAEQVRAPSMTRTVKALEARGLVRRQNDADDRRVIRIRASPRGARLLRQGRSRRVSLFAEWLTSASETEFRHIERATRVLTRLLHEDAARPRAHD